MEQTSGHAEVRDPEELAEAINRLPAEQYRKLRSMLRSDYNLRLPFRRAIPCPADPVAAEAAAVEAEADPRGPVAVGMWP